MVISRISPNTARMWDYVMGGAHNFAVDRAAVKLAQKLYPLYEESMLQQRYFLQRAVTYMVKEKKLDKFLDFGSGLPTRGNIHEIVLSLNPHCKVIYSDKDPIAVALGQEILDKTTHVRYVYCDIEEPAHFFDSPIVTELFGDDKQIGIGFVGVFLYIPDQALAAFFDTLYKWADFGSCIAVTCAGTKVKKVKGVEEASKKTGLKFYSRSAQKAEKLIGDWKVTEPGVAPGFYWGLPEDSPEINEKINELSYCFVACK